MVQTFTSAADHTSAAPLATRMARRFMSTARAITVAVMRRWA